MANKRKVILKGDEPIINEDGVATETIKPGYFVKGVSYISLQTGTTGSIPKAIALERDELGTGIDNTYQEPGAGSAFYASGDKVKVAVLYSGCEFTGFIASGENISEDDLLECDGAGALKEGSTKPIARAKETLGVVTAATACRCEAL